MKVHREELTRRELIEALRVRLAAARRSPRGVVVGRFLLEAALKELMEEEDER